MPGERPRASTPGGLPIDPLIAEPLIAELREVLTSAAAQDGRLEEIDAWFLRRRDELHASPDGGFRALVQLALAAVWSGLNGYTSADDARARLRELERQLSDRRR